MRSFLKSVRHASCGVVYVFRQERNFQIEGVVALVVLLASFAWPLSVSERALIFVMICLVLVLEIFNTAFERLLDMLKPHVHPYVKVIKDLVAGAVLIASLFAIFIGGMILLPYWIS